MCERARCNGGETNSYSSTFLDVCAEWPLSAASNPHSKTCHWHFDQGIRIPLDNALDVEKIRMDLILLRNWRDFFGARNLAISTATNAVYSQGHNHTRYFITSYKIGDEFGVVSGLLFEFLQTETRRPFWPSLRSQGTNLAELRLMFKLSATIRWTVHYDSHTVSQIWWIV